jgi:hypothetical protein
MNAVKDGLYSYKFSGFNKSVNNTFHLVGIGVLSIKSDKIINGFHSSSIINVNMGSSDIKPNTEFKTDGSVSKSEKFEGVLIANVTFTQTIPAGGKQQNLKGTFTLCSFGEDRYTIISTGAKHVLENGQEGPAANECVTGDVVRIGD